MPLISLFKRLVGAESSPPPGEEKAAAVASKEVTPELPPSETNDAGAKRPVLPPPMSKAFSAAGPSGTASTASMGSLRSQVESERKSGLTASAAYRNFTEGGTADGGHWNDPPTVVFKAQPSPTATLSSAKRGAVSPSSKASSFVLVEEAPAEPEAKAEEVDVPEDRREQEATASRLLRSALDAVALDTPMAKRMADDTAKRLALLDERLPELDAAVVRAICAIALRVDAGQLAEALAGHRDLMQAGFDSEL
ncbi:hypothetical protein GGI24_004568, partial [Coemansia furcata]